MPTAVVYCAGNFGQIDGKTANGLVRHSQAYRVLSVIDSRLDGSDCGQVLDNVNNGIPIHKDLEATVAREASIPDTLIYGMAPSTGKLSVTDRCVMLHAIALGMNIVSGLHEYLGDAPKERSCLNCKVAFWSKGFGQRICARCKGTLAWRTAIPEGNGKARRRSGRSSS
ncbi:MAG: DUF1611 domain-containing protein [Pseudomonadota bacterium]